MSQTELIEQLKQLYEHLPDDSVEDARHRQIIADLLENLESRDIGHEGFDPLADLDETMKMLLVRYEGEHPVITGVLRSLGNTLQGMGI